MPKSTLHGKGVQDTVEARVNLGRLDFRQLEQVMLDLSNMSPE
jgi:hypothetical protein